MHDLNSVSHSSDSKPLEIWYITFDTSVKQGKQTVSLVYLVGIFKNNSRLR